jgi:hypothetical protein
MRGEGRTRLTTRLWAGTVLVHRGHPAVVPFLQGIEWKSQLERWWVIRWISEGFRGAGVFAAGRTGQDDVALVLFEGPAGFVLEAVVRSTQRAEIIG